MVNQAYIKKNVEAIETVDVSYDCSITRFRGKRYKKEAKLYQRGGGLDW